MIYRCRVCGYIFDEEKEGKLFSELDTCPLCKVGTTAFECVGGRPFNPDGEEISVTRVAIYDCRGSGRNAVRKANEISAQCKMTCKKIFGEYCEYYHYIDMGMYSENNMKRPFFQRMMADIEAGKIDVVVVLVLSVIATEVSILLETYQKLKECGVKLVTVKDGESVMEVLDQALE